MMSADALRQRVRDLGHACGFGLELVEESVFADGPFFSATARSPSRSSASRAVNLEALAKISLSRNDAGEIETWALVFLSSTASAWPLRAGAT